MGQASEENTQESMMENQTGHEADHEPEVPDTGSSPEPQEPMVDEPVVDEFTMPRKLAPPVCPHCGKGPARIVPQPLQLGQMLALIMSCGFLDCRKIISIQVVEQQAPQVLPAGMIPPPIMNRGSRR